MRKSQLLVAGIATLGVVGGAATLTATKVNAQKDSTSLVERLASTFNLSKEEVKEVFDAHRDEQQAERRAEISERLQAKVDSGDLTAAQKSAIEQKLQELDEKREAERDALKAWADENNIDMKYLMGRGHFSSNRLDDAVSDGDITEAQKALIETKRDELQQTRESAHDELKQWAEDQGLDLQDLMPFGGRMHGRGGMME